MMNYSASIYPWAEEATEIITMSPNLIQIKAVMVETDEKGLSCLPKTHFHLSGYQKKKKIFDVTSMI